MGYGIARGRARPGRSHPPSQGSRWSLRVFRWLPRRHSTRPTNTRSSLIFSSIRSNRATSAEGGGQRAVATISSSVFTDSCSIPHDAAGSVFLSFQLSFTLMLAKWYCRGFVALGDLPA